MRDDFREKNLKQWEETLNNIFPLGVPEYYSWTNLEEIVSIFNKIGSINSLNHSFFPSGGGLDLTSAKLSIEPQCIELNFGGCINIFKPKSLDFNSFGGANEWSYFRLETDELKPSGVYDDCTFCYEELTEIEPGKYVDRGIWEYGYYGYDENGQEKRLPKSARVVARYFNGSLVVFAKTSVYNQIDGTYDARHNKMGAEEFRKYITDGYNYFINNG